MKLPDTNVLVNSVNEMSPQCAQATEWLVNAFEDSDGVGFSWLALVGFIRVSTQKSLLPKPLAIGDAMGLIDDWLSHPHARILHPTQRHGDVLARLLLIAGTAGNLTNDAHLAALSIEHGATVGTFDRDFKKFPGIKLDLLT
ncbi:MAG: TA system VapC family ribonuclease toxin [Pseudomonadota bacterium]